MKETEKKKLWIFIAVAYGVAYVMNIVMIIGFKKDYDLSTCIATQMMYPACGVILGKLIFAKEEKELPKAGFITILVSSLIMVIMSLLSIIFYIKPLNIGGVNVDIWYTALSVVIMISSVVAYILFWTCGKEKRSNAGLCRKKIALSILFILLFVVLIVFRIYVAGLYSAYVTGEGTGALSSITEMLLSGSTWANALFVIAYSLPLSWVMFFGEEYGWRYYLQPIMQKKFGLRLGVILLGIIWGLWHAGLDCMYYSTETGLQMIVAQQITCISLAIFFGYVYMKTENIWTIAILHFLNNTLVAVFRQVLMGKATGDMNVFQGQTVTWSQIPQSVIAALVFVIFIFAPIYGKKKEEI